MFEISFKRKGRIVVARVFSRQLTDTLSVTDFGDELLAFFEDHPEAHLLLDFSSVAYMSSAMITELLRVNERVTRSKATMRLCGFRKEIRQIFEMMQLESMFHIEDDCKACLKRYHKEVSDT